MSSFKLPITGGCRCKDIRYEITLAPLNMGICHCHACQQATGSSFYPFLVVETNSFKLQGAPTEYTELADSGKKVTRCFCSRCGSLIFGKPEAWSHIRTIAAGSLDQPASFKPHTEVWTEQKHTWFTLTEGIPCFLKNLK